MSAIRKCPLKEVSAKGGIRYKEVSAREEEVSAREEEVSAREEVHC